MCASCSARAPPLPIPSASLPLYHPHVFPLPLASSLFLCQPGSVFSAPFHRALFLFLSSSLIPFLCPLHFCFKTVSLPASRPLPLSPSYTSPEGGKKSDKTIARLYKSHTRHFFVLLGCILSYLLPAFVPTPDLSPLSRGTRR